MADSPGYPVPFISSAIREGQSATAALNAYRAAGGSTRTQTWYRAWGQVSASIADYSDELGRPQNRRPVAGEINAMTTRHASGYLQQAQVFMRDRETGEIVSKHFSLRGQGVISRNSLVDTAIDTYAGFADQYQMQVVGAIYTGTYELQPDEE